MPRPWWPCFKVTKTIFELIQDIIGTNLLTRVYYSHIRKNAPPRGGHVFQPTGIIFVLVQDIIGMNLLTEFHEYRTINGASRTNILTIFHDDWTINVASRVKNAPPPCGHVFQPKGIIFELVQDIIGMNYLTKFHENWTINVASRENAPPLGSHVFQTKVTIFKLIQDSIMTNLRTKFYEDREINVASRVLTRKKCPAPWQPYIIRMNLLTKFLEDWTINEKCTVPWQPCFSSKVTIFELIQDIIGTNLLSKKNAPPPGGHVFQPTGIIFELIQGIIGMNLLTKFHEDQTINVASRLTMLENQTTAPPHH
ncbi:hypothetical protein DPMN_154687 [Dreissena polymorpha]|uniref:Uncharacterized protein n=1 Tax=Dreissena polymorpha TaxID=45954 RepID=A0A9D4FPR2_DREPO|nr:hypothetical protein DPMN_154687 [Dreissena polymorpha]